MFPTAGKAGRVQPEGLEPLSARERAEGSTGNDCGPMEASQRPVLPAQLLQPRAERNKESARSVGRLGARELVMCSRKKKSNVKIHILLKQTQTSWCRNKSFYI